MPPVGPEMACSKFTETQGLPSRQQLLPSVENNSLGTARTHSRTQASSKADSLEAAPPSSKQCTTEDTQTVASSATEVAPRIWPSTGNSAAAQPRRAAGARATRAVRPGAVVPVTHSKRQATRKTPEVKRVQVNTVTDKELGTITRLNTARNEVYFCTLDRNAIKRDGPRPPSPCKVRTIAEREEEEKKLGREARAKRRGTGRRSGECSSDQEEPDKPLSLADLLPPLKHVRGAGDEEDYQTPARPLKRSRKSGVTSGAGDDPSPTAGPKRKKSRVTLSKTGDGVGVEKFVRWDKGLVVIDRPEPSVPQHHREGEGVPSFIKSCLKIKESVGSCFHPFLQSAQFHLPIKQIQLDHLGNLPHATAPIPKLKRNRIPVACFWYDGEEPPVSAAAPVVVASSSTGSRRGKK